MKLTHKKFKKVPGIYIITNLITGKAYVGETLNIHERMSSHRRQQRGIIGNAFKKYGLDMFDIYIEYFPNFKKNDLLELEAQLIIKVNSLTPNGYNVCPTGCNLTGFKHSDETKNKIRLAMSGRKHTVESKLKMSIAMTGIERSTRVLTESHKRNISIANKGKKRTQAVIEKMSIAAKARIRPPHAEETKQKLSQSMKIRMDNGYEPFKNKATIQ